MSRADCLRWLQIHNYPMPSKSACTFCPYHDNATWAALKRGQPEAFAEAVAVDRAIREGVSDGANGKRLSPNRWYVHRSLQPLEKVEFTGNPDQLNMFENECEGMCGV